MGLGIGRDFDLNAVVAINQALLRLAKLDSVQSFDDLADTCSFLVQELRRNHFVETLDSEAGREFEQETEALALLNVAFNDFELELKLTRDWIKSLNVNVLLDILNFKKDPPPDRIKKAADFLKHGLNEDKALHQLATEAGLIYIPIIRQWAERLQKEFLHELKKLRIYLPEERNPDIEKWARFASLTEPDRQTETFPLKIEEGFQEAARCLIFDQYTACAVMAMRTAEAMLREFCHRIMNEAPGGKTWGEMLQQMNGKLDKDLAKALEHGNRTRNEVVHPNWLLAKEDKGKAQQFFNQAVQIASNLVDDLNSRNLSLSVCVSEEADVDMMVAAWLLHREAGGVGRIELKSSDDKNLDISEYDELIDLPGSKYTLASGEGWAEAVAKEHEIESSYIKLINYCKASILARSEHRLVVASDSPELTLESLVGSILASHTNHSEAFRQCALLFDKLMKDDKLDPLHPKLAESLPAFDEYVVKKQRLMKMEEAIKTAKQFRYDRQIGIAATLPSKPSGLFKEFANQLFKEGFKIVALTDEAESLLIVSTEKVNWKPIIDSLRPHPQIESIEKSLTIEHCKVQQKLPIKISFNDLLKCIPES